MLSTHWIKLYWQPSILYTCVVINFAISVSYFLNKIDYIFIHDKISTYFLRKFEEIRR